jgi:hypothetical protein
MTNRSSEVDAYIDNLSAERKQALTSLRKSCIRFRKWENLPVETIRQILEESV